MAEVLIIPDNGLIQAEDNLTWNFGLNTVNFIEPFSDTDYWFTAWTDNAVVREVRASRTVSSTVVDVSALSTQCSWEAKGQSEEIRTSGVLSIGIGANGLIQRGVKSLVQGLNTITFSTAFASGTSYTFPNVVAVSGTILNINSQSATQIVLDSPGVDELRWLAIGE
jgi:hypothetical protein